MDVFVHYRRYQIRAFAVFIARCTVCHPHITAAHYATLFAPKAGFARGERPLPGRGGGGGLAVTRSRLICTTVLVLYDYVLKHISGNVTTISAKVLALAGAGRSSRGRIEPCAVRGSPQQSTSTHTSRDRAAYT
ncbi:unnamed protein product [Colias eurytheme]|nr:unnamed protein product [Colias eurytheme]